MEQRGIRTDKGDYNRQVESINMEIKQTKARIRKVKNWLYAQPLTNAPSLVDIMGRIADGKNLKSNWQRVRNLQTTAKILSFLTKHDISSVENFSDTVVRINERLKTVTDDINKAERQLETLATHLDHADNHKAHKAVYQKYKRLTPKADHAELNSLNPFTKNKATKDYEAATQQQNAYYEKHAEEIQAYLAAKQHFDAVMNGRKYLPIKDWKKEQRDLIAKRYALCDEYYSIKEETSSLEAIRRSIESLICDDVLREQHARTQVMVVR